MFLRPLVCVWVWLFLKKYKGWEIPVTKSSESQNYSFILSWEALAPKSKIGLLKKQRSWGSSLIETSAVGVSVKVVSSCVNYVPGAYRKALASQAPRKVLSSSTFVTNSSSSSRKADNKHAGRKPICVRPTPKWQKGIGEFFRLSPKDSKKENHIPEEAGSSGWGKATRKSVSFATSSQRWWKGIEFTYLNNVFHLPTLLTCTFE